MRHYVYGALSALAVYTLVILTTERGLRSATVLASGAAQTGDDQVRKVIDELDQAFAAAEQAKADAADPETREYAEGKRQGVGLGLFSVRRHLT